MLSTADALIAEQDPTRLDNLIYSLGPFALLGMVRVGKIDKLARLGRLVGRPARRVLGGNPVCPAWCRTRPFARELTHAEIYNAFRHTPLTPSNHAILRLKDVRTWELGMETLNDFARHVNHGIIEDAGRGLMSIEHGRFATIVNPKTRIIVTLTPR